MKVYLVNGSPHEKGCTAESLSIIAETLGQNGVDSEVFWLGCTAKDVQSGCIACGHCFEAKKCVFDDKVNQFLPKLYQADGVIFGSPVHYAAASGSITAFMDRLFFCAEKPKLRMKPAASIVVARRAGTTAALDQLNKYFLINQMPIVPSQYWAMTHGAKPEDVRKDAEGVQIMQTLGRNMAWMLKAFAKARETGVELPAYEKIVRTNFV